MRGERGTNVGRERWHVKRNGSKWLKGKGEGKICGRKGRFRYRKWVRGNYCDEDGEEDMCRSKEESPPCPLYPRAGVAPL